MKRGQFTLFLCLTAWLAMPVQAALTPQQVAGLPPAATHKVSFATEIKPIFEASCIKCHARGKDKGGFKMDDREAFLKGGSTGPAAIPGNSAGSYIIELVAGVDPDNVMPMKGTKLSPVQVGIMRAWIDQGMNWDSSISFARPDPLNLHPNRPELPRVDKGLSNPVDRLLQPYFEKHGIQPAGPVNDRMFARRVYLDTIGLLPPPAELEVFLKDRRKDKRERLVKKLLSDDQRYAQHWMTFWNDALRNDYAGTGYIDGGRKQISSWLYSALATNLPYDKFVAQLINPNRDSEGFTKGIVWRGAVNASQIPPLQAAQHISQVFMGVNLKCASCHDSFINDWSLADAYGLANIYSDEALEMFHCDKPTGKKAATKFIYAELGEIDGALKKSDRMKRLAEVISGPKNGRLTRTMVNRLWAQFMGRGLVDSLDDMEQPAWHPALLDWLAEDLASNGYNLRHTMERILTSRAYQMPAVSIDEQSHKDLKFQGPVVRRLSSEQYRDALGSLADVWFERGEAEFDFLARTGGRQESMLAKNLQPIWIWHTTNALKSTAVETVFWRRTLQLNDRTSEAFAVCSVDNSFTLFLNGNKIATGNDWERPRLIDLRPYLLKGENVLALEAVNSGDKDKPNPAGLLFYARVRSQEGGRIMDFRSDASWKWSTLKSEGWERPGFDDKTWKTALVQEDSQLAADDGRRLERRFSAILSATKHYGRIRTSLVRSDPLTVALGRPNREQVVTSRPAAATTLQALELTNGETLDGLLKKGAERLVQGGNSSPDRLVNEVYLRALGRKPTAAELGLAMELVGAPAKKEGVEDLLWSMTMLPEFQLIY